MGIVPERSGCLGLLMLVCATVVTLCPVICETTKRIRILMDDLDA